MVITFGPCIEKRTETVMLADRRALLIVRRTGPGGVKVILTELDHKRGRWRFAKPMPLIPSDALPALIAALTGGKE